MVAVVVAWRMGLLPTSEGFCCRCCWSVCEPSARCAGPFPPSPDLHTATGVGRRRDLPIFPSHPPTSPVTSALPRYDPHHGV